MGEDLLGVSAVRQIVARLRKSEKEEDDLVAKLERSCTKFDRTKTGSLTVDEYFNVVRIQNHVEISKDEVGNIIEPRLSCLTRFSAFHRK
jgi:hypothetical protein